jgi:hypothetical protein
LSTSEFWDVMQRWHIPDRQALELIEYPGRLGAAGKRPRFRLTTRQRRLTSYLAEIDAVLPAAGKQPEWLQQPINAAPFARRAPIEHMLRRGMAGMADLLQFLSREAMRKSLGQ